MTLLTRTLLTQPQRLAVPDTLFGSAFGFRIEPTIYHLTSMMAESYNGAYWEMYSLGNGGFYMAPDVSECWEIRCPNQYTGTLSSDALGIVACLCAYSHLSFRISEQYARTCAEHFHLLRAYALDHAETAEIFGSID